MNTHAADIESLVCEAGGRTVLALPRLRIAHGERVALIGHNGAGKSTLLRALSGFTVPTQGRLRVLGHDLGRAAGPRALRALRAEVGQVMQGLHLVQRLTARENVLVGALARTPGWRSWVRLHRAGDIAEAERALVAVGLGASGSLRADRLSGGERQKVAIARMLMQRPRLILADEPTASLDPAAARESCELLSRCAAGATLISVVHQPALLPMLADRVIGLRDGRLAFDLPVAAVDDAALAGLYASDAAAAPTVVRAGSTPPREAGSSTMCLPRTT